LRELAENHSRYSMPRFSKRRRWGNVSAAISSILVGQRFWLGLLGGLFLLYLGMRTLLARPAEQAASADSRQGLAGANAHQPRGHPVVRRPLRRPGPGGGRRLWRGALLVVGIFLGSAAWWLTLSLLVSGLRALRCAGDGVGQPAVRADYPGIRCRGGAEQLLKLSRQLKSGQ
jgi:hypothetical protein